MKSKSFELPKQATEKVKPDKTYDFINYYKPASETNVKLVDKLKSEDAGSKETTSNIKSRIFTRERSPNKKKKKLKDDSINISKINIDSNNLPHSSRREDGYKVTSTPNAGGKKDINENVKSIMKNSSTMDNSVDTTKVCVTKNKPKKRNKSVSFMLDDTETVAIKRSKSELSVMDIKISQNSKSNFGSLKTKKPKKKSQDGKENKVNANNFKVEIDTSDDKKDASKENAKSEKGETCEVMDIPTNEKQDKLAIKKNKRQKKTKHVENSADQEPVNGIQIDEDKEKKKKKKKRQAKQIKDKTDAESEPATKTSKKDIKPDVIAQDLENLSIGDNAHTLTNLLDEMTVVDKKKKLKKAKKNKQQNSDLSTDMGETKLVEEKEKVKWIKRKWNKDKKGGVNDDKLVTSIVVENLPLKIMCNYKKLLTEHFTMFGPIKLVGIAEVYSIEHPEVFTTTINFESEDAANKALEEDNTLLEGNRIRVKRPLPPSQTTLVVRSYADLSEPALSSVFTSAGRIRNVRRLVKGKKSMCTAFIEFDGPEAVERAIKMAEDVKIGGKKLFAAKFELRNKNKKLKIDKKNEYNGASDDSSD
ncbi:cylicin-1-like [Nymphalis io]|uniref:cylicin-1-like n=1 Tax=Inachis io TaxID=171585 RepID=UPI002168DB88|nr:cylicin-1-like [Nymphalis io]